jgi:hypothetical protein
LIRYPRRVRASAGSRANVDGIPFELPVGTHDSPALFAAFPIHADRARRVLPGRELHPCRVGSRGVLIVAVVNYLHTSIGRYVEFCIGILCTRGSSQAPPLLPLALQRVFGTGVYIYDLPVSTEISVKGGLGIWGMPKRQANLDFLIGDRTVSSQYDLDGQLVMRIDIPRSEPRFPLVMKGVGYGDFRGMLTKSYIYLRGRMGLTLMSDSNVSLLLGDHPRIDPIRSLAIDPRPIFTGFVPAMEGVLDDHIETWFQLSDMPPGPPPVGLRDVVDLELRQDWLAPPDREHSDRLLREMSPRERVAVRSPSHEGRGRR